MLEEDMNFCDSGTTEKAIIDGENESNFKIQSKKLYKLITDTYTNDYKYIKRWRRIWTIFIIILVGICISLSAFIIIYSVFKTINTSIAITTISAVFAEIIGLVTIIFKYIFNKTDNKNADVYLKLLEITNDYESYNKHVEADKENLGKYPKTKLNIEEMDN